MRHIPAQTRALAMVDPKYIWGVYGWSQVHMPVAHAAGSTIRSTLHVARTPTAGPYLSLTT